MDFIFIGMRKTDKEHNQVFIDGLNAQELYASINPGRWKRIKKKFTLKLENSNYLCEEQNSQDIIEIATDHPWQDIIGFARKQGFPKSMISFEQVNWNVTDVRFNSRFDKKWQVDRVTYTMSASHLFFPRKNYDLIVVKNSRSRQAFIISPNHYDMPRSKNV